jgi:hypothetical protein
VTALGNAGVVDQDIHPAELLEGCGGQPIDLLGIRKVADPATRFGGVLPTASEDLVEARLPAGTDAYDGTATGELLGQTGPDAR